MRLVRLLVLAALVARTVDWPLAQTFADGHGCEPRGCRVVRKAKRAPEARRSPSSVARDGRPFVWDPVNNHVIILHPSKIQKGQSQVSYKAVFAVWAREIVKPDFAIQHAAKAVRLLPKCSFYSLRYNKTEPPVLRTLLDRTRELLKLGDVPSQHLASMLRACALLRTSLPVLQAELVPEILPLLFPALPEMSTEDLSTVILAASDLQQEYPELLEKSLNSNIFASKAESVPTENLPKLIDIIVKFRNQEQKRLRQENSSGTTDVGPALTALGLAAQKRLDNMTLAQLATLSWAFGRAEAFPDCLKAELPQAVAQRTPSWSWKEIDPDLWRIVCALAHCKTAHPGLLRATARVALREHLASMSPWGVAALSWSFEELRQARDGFDDFRRHLAREVALRNFTKEQVVASRKGPDGGGDPKWAAFWSDLASQARERKGPLGKFEVAKHPSLGLFREVEAAKALEAGKTEKDLPKLLEAPEKSKSR